MYRRTLAPVMLLLGALGLAAAAIGWQLPIAGHRAFVIYWIAVSILGMAGAFMMVRRQALREGEPFWSPPTRRVTQAFLPPVAVGFLAALIMIMPQERDSLVLWWLPPLWMALYGCALHAAGFFMQRGIRLFGWIYLLASAAVSWRLAFAGGVNPLHYAHLVMGAAFGGLHLAYALYLYFTDSRKSAA